MQKVRFWKRSCAGSIWTLNLEGNYALGGWVGGAFQGCGWIEYDAFKPKPIKSKPTTACSEIAGGEHEVNPKSFMAEDNKAVGDGYFVVNKVACPEYANYRPWSSSNLEQEKIRTVPAYASQEPGSNVPELKWRYVTKYSSTDGTGQYVMVRDATVTLKKKKTKKSMAKAIGFLFLVHAFRQHYPKTKKNHESLLSLR